MESSRHPFFRPAILLLASMICLGAGPVEAVTATNQPAATDTNRFGFTGPEIFPIDPDIALLRAADLDGDGLNDLIVVNNARSKINLLYNQTGKTNLTAKARAQVKRELNELPPDARFRIDSIASEKRITSLVVADLNGDGRPDLAYYGEPKELIVQYNLGTNGWSAPKRWPIDDGQLFTDSLAVGDLNGDGRNDLLLLGENCVYYLAQKADHTLAEPVKIPYTGAVKAIQVLDIDGDGRSDLLLVNWDSDSPFRFRLQQPDGELGPENYFSLPRIRAFCADNLETNKETELVSIAQNSGRAGVSHFMRKPGDPLSGAFRQGQFSVLPLNKTDKPHRGMVWADINGDGLPDLLVAEPDSGQLSVYFQKPDGTLAAPKKFSTLTGITDIAVANWEGDGRPDIFLLSADERRVGVTRLDDKQSLPFPTLLPMDGRPLVMAAGPLQRGAKPTLAVILDQDGRRVLWTRTAGGPAKIQKLNVDFKSNPVAMVMQDANQDGLTDLVLLIPYEKLKVLVQEKGRDFVEADVAPPGGVMDAPWCAVADVDGDGKPELLLPQKNFLRAVVLKPEAPVAGSTNQPGWTFLVKDQINGTDSSSQLIGAAAVPNGTNPVPSLFLLDAERKFLTLCERDSAGAWQVVRNLVLPPYTEFLGLSLCPLALGGTNANSVGVMGQNAVAWQALHGRLWDIAELDGYETPIKDGYLNDVVSGDLSHTGRKDLVFMETAKNYLDLVAFSADHKLVPANRWQVFEERTFRSRRTDLAEPREALVSDVTGDGKNDLIIIVHDRILVYPQE
jgi:FG-GAP-like repeat